MKHLKRIAINESKQDLYDFCNSHLAIMFDSGRFSIYIKDTSVSYIISIEPVVLVMYDEIKDDFIPFLHMLSITYPIYEYSGSGPKLRANDNYYSISEILEDKISDIGHLYLLQIVMMR